MAQPLVLGPEVVRIAAGGRQVMKPRVGVTKRAGHTLGCDLERPERRGGSVVNTAQASILALPKVIVISPSASTTSNPTTTLRRSAVDPRAESRAAAGRRTLTPSTAERTVRCRGTAVKCSDRRLSSTLVGAGALLGLPRACPTPGLRAAAQPCPDRIHPYVLARRGEVALRVDATCPEASGEEMSEALIPRVEPLRVHKQQPMHPARERVRRGLDHDVDVRVHHAVGVYRPRVASRPPPRVGGRARAGLRRRALSRCRRLRASSRGNVWPL